MRKTESNLLKRGKNYSVRYCVPRELWETVGKREIIRSLGTSSIDEARRRKREIIHEIEARIYRAKPVRMCPAALPGDFATRNMPALESFG